MKLALLDIDGTLTQTSAVDAICFTRALRETFGVEEVDADWTSYPHCTDAGLAAESYRRRFGRAPAAGEIARFTDCFVCLLAEQQAARPQSFAKTPSADAFLRFLATGNAWTAAIATGCWSRPARLKLRAAGLEAPFPLVTSDHVISREGILQRAIEEARACHAIERFERVVSVGDGPWDVNAARALGLPFVGIGSGGRAARLREFGASHVLPDFTDLDAVRRALEEARVPG